MIQFNDVFSGRRVFVTGHTGFKGSWLSLCLTRLGAQVTGYSLSPPTDPSLFELARIGDLVRSYMADIRDQERLCSALREAQPEIVFHLAAQPLVRDSYRYPVETYSTNVMGTVHLLEAVRGCPSVRAVVNVTTDKCYENSNPGRGHRETDGLGGFDPYSNSKACSELVTAAFRSSFFNPARFANHGVALATARAGNVIGGGDWATDRLVPDIIRSLLAGEEVLIRNPRAIRPWQHVLESLDGYLTLAQRLFEQGTQFAQSWNFGPSESDAQPVEWIVQRICRLWGATARYRIDVGDQGPHESEVLTLDCSSSLEKLGWQRRCDLEGTVQDIMQWVAAYRDGADLQQECLRQIGAYYARTGSGGAGAS